MTRPPSGDPILYNDATALGVPLIPRSSRVLTMSPTECDPWLWVSAALKPTQ